MTQATRNPINTLLNLWSTAIGPHMPSPREVLHYRTLECQSQSPHPINIETVLDYLILKKIDKKHYYDKAHDAQWLPELRLSQKVLFLSPAELSTYILGSRMAQAATLPSYVIKSQGKQYWQTWQHISALHPEIAPVKDTRMPQEPQPAKAQSHILMHSAAVPLDTAVPWSKHNPLTKQYLYPSTFQWPENPSSHLSPKPPSSPKPHSLTKPNPLPRPSSATVEQLLSHLASINDCNPLNSSSHSDAYTTYQCSSLRHNDADSTFQHRQANHCDADDLDSASQPGANTSQWAPGSTSTDFDNRHPGSNAT